MDALLLGTSPGTRAAIHDVYDNGADYGKPGIERQMAATDKQLRYLWLLCPD